MEEVAHGIVVLEPVQAADRYVLALGRGGGSAQLRLKCGEQVGTLRLSEPGLVLRRHIGRIDHLDQFLDQLRVGKKLFIVGNLLEVDLAFHLFAAVTLHAVFGEERFEELIKLIGLRDRVNRDQQQEQAAPLNESFGKHRQPYPHISEIKPVLSAKDSISNPINLATESHRLEFSVPLLHWMKRPWFTCP